MVINIHKKRIWLIVLFVYLWMQQVLLHYTEGFVRSVIQYSDEFFMCIVIVMMIFAVAQKRIRLLKVELWLLGLFALFVLVGLVSSVVYQHQTFWLSFVDMLVCSRFVVIYFGVRILLPQQLGYDELVRELAWVCRVFTVITAVLALHDLLFTPFFDSFDYRYAMNSLQLFFPHPTYMAIACATAAIALIAANAVEYRRTARLANMWCVVIQCVLMCLTLRSKAIAAAVCILVFYFIMVKLQLRSKALLFGGGSLVALAIGWDQLEFYFAMNVSDILRARMHIDAMNLANEYFPLGTGFGTFGSSTAAEHYSPIYYQLGYASLHGADVEDPTFLCDTFWPTVIAQCGWIGAIAFVAVIVCFVIIIFRAQKINRYFYCGMMCIMTYEIISSIAEPAFFNPASGVLFALFGLMVNMCDRDRVGGSEYGIYLEQGK